MDRIVVVQGDTPVFEFTILDANDKPLDLGLVSTIIFKMARVGEEDGHVAEVCSISNVPGTDGKCYIGLTAAQTEDDGEYLAEVEIHMNTGEILSPLQFTVGIVNEVDEPKLDTPVVVDLVTPNVTGDYQVAWSTVDDATSYVLEEDDGTGWSTVYSGPNTYYDVTGNTDGSYFYRVTATASYHKNSDVSDVVGITVDIP